MKSENWIVIEIGGALVLIVLVSFWVTPAYSKAVDLITEALVAGFSGVLGYKFGKSMPQQYGDAKPGQSSQTETTTQTSAPDPAKISPAA